MLNTLIPELVLRFDFVPTRPAQEWTTHNGTVVYQEDFQVEVRGREFRNQAKVG